MWRRPLASESTPLVVGRLVYVGAWDRRVYALFARTGAVAWSFRTDGEVNSSPAYSSGTVYVGTSGGSIYALNARSAGCAGARSFSRFAHGREYFYATPTVAYGRVYASNTDGTVYAYGAATGHLPGPSTPEPTSIRRPRCGAGACTSAPTTGASTRSTRRQGTSCGAGTLPGSIHGAPTVMDGLVYFATCGTCGQRGSRYAKRGPRATFALDALTGKLVWRFPDGHYSPVVADRTRVYLAGSTRVYAPGAGRRQEAASAAASATPTSGQARYDVWKTRAMKSSVKIETANAAAPSHSSLLRRCCQSR